MTTDIASNRLPILAAEIRRAHGDVREALKTAAEHAVDAGRALIEAKSLVKHGEWLPWLRVHCRLPERTAQLYMHVAELTDKLGLKSATVADLGLRFLGKMNAAGAFHTPNYNPFHHCDEEGKRQWLLYILHGAHSQHVEWVLNKQFKTPDEWHGEVGATWRRSVGIRRDPAPRLLKEWGEFQLKHAADSIADIEAALAEKAEREEALADAARLREREEWEPGQGHLRRAVKRRARRG
jgi:Protein of unknown function (DUF3102)